MHLATRGSGTQLTSFALEGCSRISTTNEDSVLRLSSKTANKTEDADVLKKPSTKHTTTYILKTRCLLSNKPKKG